ncbi:MAG: glutamine--fructose-6-phosphate transaminase (isomerizing) [Chloroflexota bacterium]|nr:glutamine--fructose-6-phosphate transaminase (isomerizing) [Chloroflexota bacterium]
MCGVFAYLGASRDVGETVGTALKRLEYRGYDSWGIAWESDRKIQCTKRTGRVNGSLPKNAMSALAFGHTRWATHGDVTDVNAHPHLDCAGRIAVVHNGIVENVDALRLMLQRRHNIKSETDSEVIAHLLEACIERDQCSLADAVRTVFPMLEGFNAVVAIDVQRQELVATKFVSPLVLGSGSDGHFVSSDVIALKGHTDRFSPVEDGWLVSLHGSELRIEDLATRQLIRVEQVALPDLAGASSFDRHAEPGVHMAREMDQQPAVIRGLMDDLAPVRRLAQMIDATDHVVLTGCGSAFYAAEAGRYLLARSARRAVTVLPASEVRQFAPTFRRNTLLIALTQSGETADLIDALMAAEAVGVQTAALVNVEHSTIARRVSHVVPLRAGTERCVLATKSFVAKLVRLIQLADLLAPSSPGDLAALPLAADAMEHLLVSPDVLAAITRAGDALAAQHSAFVIGRGLSYPCALEAALKVKEGSYLHAEAFAGGELKHGVISLVEEGTPCIVFAPNDDTYADTISGAQELKSRGGVIIGVGEQGSPAFDIHVPVADIGAPTLLLHVAVAQRIAHHVAMRRGTDPDHPRNLAKSVTVK